MLALGIDPGTAICGYGFVEQVGSRLVPRAYGAITTSPKMPMEERLMKLYDELDALIKENRPDVMGVEQLFFNRNITTAIPVGQARGIVLLAAAKNGLQLVDRAQAIAVRTLKECLRGLSKIDMLTAQRSLNIVLDNLRRQEQQRAQRLSEEQHRTAEANRQKVRKMHAAAPHKR